MKVAAGTPKQVPPADDGRFHRPPEQFDLHDYEAYIKTARWYSKKVCYHHPEWDAADLEGSILEALLIWPPKDPERARHHVMSRCKFATADWTRSRIGRQGQKALVFSTDSLDEMVNQKGDKPITLGDILPDHMADTEAIVVANIMRGWGEKLIKHDRDRVVLNMFVEGFNLREIGETLGVTESRVSQIITGRIKPILRRVFDLEGMRIVGSH